MASTTSLVVSNDLPLRVKKTKSDRVFEIDFLRGFDIFLMVAIHFCCDLSMINSFFRYPAGTFSNPDWVQNMKNFGFLVFSEIDWGHLYVLEFFFSSLFMFISGISCTFSHSNIQRAIKLGFVSIFLTILLEFADLFLPEQNQMHIWMGILQSLSVAMLFYSVFDYFFPSYKADYAMAVVFVILVGWMILAVNGPLFSDSPAHHYNIAYSRANIPEEGWMLLVGLKNYGDDYFAPFLTLAMFFLGAVVGKTLYRSRKSFLPEWLPTKWAKPILWIGSHSLEVYILHQPVSFLILLFILAPFGYRLPIF